MLFSRHEIDSKSDRPVVLVYAKATLEIGNLGFTGKWFSWQLKRNIPGTVAVQGAGYNCLTSPFSLVKGGSDSAAQKMVDAVHKAVKQSPEKKIVLCGYSQGASIIRKAVKQLGPEIRARITGIILFGDPSRIGSKMPTDVGDKTLNLRLPLDWVHWPIPIITVTHFWYPFLSYGEAVNFVRNQIKS
ncbi:hypothetical protein MANI_005961 [Metarhizium anisopliae]